ncbi:MAG: putative Ig domain-containing protein [Sedimentisphaerales bacterium]|nr:putative Ig domain-containing protein [Sedimentisphaerales bacterium]
MKTPRHTAGMCLSLAARYRTMLLGALFACVLVSATSAPAATYYIDAVSGNDDNSGLAPGSAWRSMAKVASSANPSDTVDILSFDASIFTADWPDDITYLAAGVTQYGITWTFGESRMIGRFANGDFWVVGPVSVTNIDPGCATISQDGESFNINGNMVNPDPETIGGGHQGYDDRGGPYDAALRLDVPISLKAGDSLVSTISWQIGEAGCPDRYDSNPASHLYHMPRPPLRVAAILTCVASAPAAGSFRPPYAGTEKPLYNVSNMNTAILPNLTAPAGLYDTSYANMDAYIDKIKRVWLDHVTAEEGEWVNPTECMPCYGRDQANAVNRIGLVLMVNIDTEAKKKLATHFCQLGIDWYHIVKAGGGWGKAGGAMRIGRKWPIILTGRLLGDTDMTNVGIDYPATSYRFQEDAQVFYIGQDEVDKHAATTRTNCSITHETYNGKTVAIITDNDGGSWWDDDNGGTQPLLARRGFPDSFWVRVHRGEGRYDVVRASAIHEENNAKLRVNQEDLDYYGLLDTGSGLTVEIQLFPAYRLGYPEWTENYYWRYNKMYYSRNYRMVSATTYHGAALGALILDCKALWNRDAYFDYTDFHMAEQDHGTPQRSWSRFTENMWDTYRSQYGPLWSGDGGGRPNLSAIGNRQITAGETLTLTVSATDPDGDNLTYSASGLPSGATFVEQTFSWTPTESQVGNHQVTFTVSDGQTQDSETITIMVTSATTNAPPVLSAIGGKSVREGEHLAFSITATDPDGDPLTYSAANLPNGASFSGRSFSWTPGYDQAGNHQVTFVASDGQAQDTETITVSVANVNRAPVLSGVGDRSVDENSLLSFSISAADPDGDSLTYSASGLPSGAGFSDRTFSWTPTSAQIGVYDVTFTASDGQLLDTETITLAVVTSGADESAPTVTSLSPQAGAIQVSLNHLIRLHVNDAGQGVDADSIVIRLDGQVIYEGDTSLHTSAYGRCSRTGTKHDYRFTYQPDKSFDCDHIANVEIDASDLAGNVMNTYSYSFLTEMRAFGSNYMASGAAGGTEPKGRPATVSDAAGNIWAVWHSGAAGSRDVYIAALTAGAHAFGTSVRLTAETADQCNPDVALASDGSLFVVWQDHGRGNWDIFASVCSDGLNWSRPIQVTDSEGNETNPVIVIDQQSPRRAYMAWQDDRNGNADIYVAVSTSAFSESTITRVTTSSADQVDPDIAVDGEDTVVIVWTDMRNGNADVYGASSSSGTWANAPVVTGSGAQTSPALAADPSASALHLLWVDDRPGNRDIYYAWSDGLPTSSLSGSSIIDDSSAADQFAPTIACVDSLRVFACWEDLRHANPSGEDSDLFMADLGPGAARTNVLIGDGGTNSSQSEPAMGIDGYGNPYVVWTDGRNAQSEVYYAATTFINPVPLDSKQVTAAVGATVGTDPAAIASKNDVSIIVPAGACQFDARVTISEILNPPVLPVECLGSYDFGPSGIDFDVPATVTIPYEFAGGVGSAKPYWYDSLTGALSQQGITEIENIVISSTLNALRFKTTHFTPFYLVAGDADAGGVIGDTSIGGGCSVSVTGSSSARDLLVPYGIIATVMLALRRSDRKKLKVLRHAQG